MKRALQLIVGLVFVALGAAMLILLVRNGGGAGGAGQAAIGPLALIGAGALSISTARRKPKKW